MKVKLAYNRLGFKRTLDEAIRTVLKSQANYMNACLMLVSEDMSLTPLGTDKELDEEELEIGREADRLVEAEVGNQYNRPTMVEKGEGIMAMKRKANKRKRGGLFGGGGGGGNAAAATPNKEEHAGGGETTDENTPSPGSAAEEEDDDPSQAPADPIIAEEDRILSFTWDGKGRFMDTAKLTATYRELEYCENQVSLYLDRLEDEINALKGVYKTILKHRMESNAYLRVYANHIKSLSAFNAHRETIVSSSKNKKF